MEHRAKTITKLFNKQSGHCFYCDREMSLYDEKSDTFATLDHIVPRSKGGLTNEFNLVAACFECNQEKGNKSLLDFILEKKHLDNDLHV